MKKTRALLLFVILLIALSVLFACGGCKHYFKEGVCVECGKTDPDYKPPCTHYFKDGICTMCGAPSPTLEPECVLHSYVGGACQHCGEPCLHPSYSGGSCTSCGTLCPHSFEQGICSVCGVADPSYPPADGGASLYSPVISRFKEIILYKYLNEILPPKGQNEPACSDTLFSVASYYNPALEFGYALRDINNDGFLELFLLDRDSSLRHRKDTQATPPKIRSLQCCR